MPWWEEILDFVGLSRARINAFVIVVGVAAIAVFALYYRGTGMIAAMAAVAVGIALAVLSLSLRAQKAPSWLLCLGGLVVAVAGAVISVKFLGIHPRRS